MLLKALFTILAILWIIQAVRPYLVARQDPGLRPDPARKNDRKDKDDDAEGEYIDYEEIK